MTHPSKTRLLFVDDDPMFLRIWRREAERRTDVEASFVATLDEARAAVAERGFDLVICDWRMDGETSAVFLQELAEKDQRAVIVTAATLDTEALLGRVVPVIEKMEISFDDLIARAG